MVAGYLYLQRFLCAVSLSLLLSAGDYMEQDVLSFCLAQRLTSHLWCYTHLLPVVGATMDLGLMWGIAETFNGLMAIPNLIAVFLLSGVVVKLVKEYFAGEGAVTK